MDKNKIKHGLSNVHVAFVKNVGEDGIPVFDTPKPIPGAVNLSTDPEGDEYKFYADNIAYYSIVNNDGYTGELEIALLPKDIAVDMLGWKLDKNGALIEVSNGKPKAFALMAQYEGDKEGGRVVYYNCKAGRPNDEYSTDEESVEVHTQTLSLTMQPIKFDDDTFIAKALMDKSDNEEEYNKFFKTVYMPTFETTKL